MDYIIREVKEDEVDKALYLVLKVFLEFDAPDYSEEGINTFKSSIIKSKNFRNKLKTKEQIMLGAFTDDGIIGVISISIRNHISLLFVDKRYHRKGVATKLFKSIVDIAKINNTDKIKLNSSIYAYEFYKKIGFRETDIEKELEGIRYIPMECKIDL